MTEEPHPEVDRRLDVRELDGAPFTPIMEELEALQPGETLLLINRFEPEPLYDVLAERGFEATPRQVDDDEWHVLVEDAE